MFLIESLKEGNISKKRTTKHVEKLKRLIENSLDDDKANDIVTIDLAGKSSLADYMIVASGTSQKHISTLAVHLVDKLKTSGIASIPVDGNEACEWVVVDAGDIIIHLFKPEARRLYNLEKMWAIPMPAAMEAVL